MELDKGIGSVEHFTDPSGWRSGDLDYFTVPPRVFTEEEHQIWKTLYDRQMKVLPGRAISTFLDSLSTLGITNQRIPTFEEMNERLAKATGWKIVPVPGFIPEDPFFEMLAARQFPVGNFIRRADQLDYIQEPDIFHDLFGHVPLLADPVYADYLECYGHGGVKATKLGAIGQLGRLYWYTVEFGLIEEPEGLRIYGAGILSSPTESVFSLESPSPNRVRFDVERMLRTHLYIDDFQDTYFVIDSFQQLYDETKPDFTKMYEKVAKLPVIMPHELIESDDVITRGTGTYAAEAQKRRKAREAQK